LDHVVCDDISSMQKMNLMLSYRSNKTANTLMIVTFVVILISNMWIVLLKGGFILTEIRYSFIQELSEGLPAQVQLSLKKALPWLEMGNWPVTIAVCLF
jgi:hypothetical protein